MIVGTTSIDYEVLKQFAGRPDDLVIYVEGLVPSWARHLPQITNNQRFYVAAHLRGVLTLPYPVRMELVNALVNGITVSGIISSFTSIHDIISACDKNMLTSLIENELRNERK